MYGQPVTLVPDLANDHLVEALQAALVEDGQHAIVPYLELVAVRLGEGELRFFLLVQALVVLLVLLGSLLALLGCGVVAKD